MYGELSVAQSRRRQISHDKAMRAWAFSALGRDYEDKTFQVQNRPEEAQKSITTTFLSLPLSVAMPIVVLHSFNA